MGANEQDLLQKSNRKWSAKKQNCLIALLTLAYIAASCFYEPVLFGASARASLLSGAIGPVATLVVSKLAGMLLIWLFWRALVRLLAGEYQKRAAISFFVLFAASLAVIAIVYPDPYTYEPDNLYLFREALTYQPAYWHHYLTGSFFAGCYMLLPHPVSLVLVQSACFSALLASLFSRLSVRFGGRRVWPVFLLLLVPAAYYVQYSPYRNCLYTILCMFAFAELLFFWLDQTPPPLSRQIRLAAAFSLIAVWRSEGILLFALLPLGLWIACRSSFGRIVLLTATSAALAVLLGLPQSVGMAQEGLDGDYKIVSTMNALQDIYNAEDFSLDYADGDTDATQIEQFVPCALLQEYGLAGYRAYNAANGRNINDSGQTQAQIDAFMGAYARVVLHNLPAFLRAQGNRFLYALKLPEVFAVSAFHGTHTELPAAMVTSTASSTSADTLASLAKGTFWRATTTPAAGSTQASIREKLGEWIYQYDAKTRRVSIVVRVLLPFAALAVAWMAGRRRKSPFPILMLLVLAAELGAVVLMAPEGRTAYYYPVLFCGYLFVLLLAPLCAANTRREKRAKQPTAAEQANLNE